MPETEQQFDAASWEQVADQFREAFPGLSPAVMRTRYEQARTMAAARAAYRNVPADEAALITGPRGFPIAGSVARVLEDSQYSSARTRVLAGRPEPDDYHVVARHEGLRQRATDASTGARLVSSGLGLAEVAGENALGGAALGAAGIAGPTLLSRAAYTSTGAAAGALGRTAALTALMPSIYAERWTHNNLTAGRDALDPAGLPAAFALGTMTTAVLGSLGQVGNSITTTGVRGVAERLLVRTGIGMGEQQVVDVLASGIAHALPAARELDTGYGLGGEIFRGIRSGDMSHAMSHALVQAVTFAAFSAIHEVREGTPRAPTRIIQAFERSSQAMAQAGIPAADAARLLGGVNQRWQEALHANDAMGRTEAMRLFQDIPEGPLRGYATALADSLPEHMPAQGPEPGIHRPVERGPNRDARRAAVEQAMMGSESPREEGPVSRPAAAPPAPEAAPPVPPPAQAPPAPTSAVVPPASPSAVQPPAAQLTARERATAVESQRLEALRRLQDAQRTENREKSNAGAGMRNNLKEARNERLQAQKDYDRLGKAMDAAHTEAAMEELRNKPPQEVPVAAPTRTVAEPAPAEVKTPVQIAQEAAPQATEAPAPVQAPVVPVPAKVAPNSLVGLWRRMRAGEPVTREEINAAAGFDARETHVLWERLAGRTLEDIAGDPQMRRRDTGKMTRERIRQIEASAREKADLPESVATIAKEIAGTPGVTQSEVENVGFTPEQMRDPAMQASLRRAKAKKSREEEREVSLEAMADQMLEWGNLAAEEGIPTDHLHVMAKEIKQQSEQDVAGVNGLIASMRKSHPEYNFIAQRAGKGIDMDAVRGLDDVAQHMIPPEFEHLFIGHPDREARLFEILVAGKQKPIGEEDAYREALERLVVQREAFTPEEVSDVNRKLGAAGQRPLAPEVVERAKSEAVEQGSAKAGEPARQDQPADQATEEFFRAPIEQGNLIDYAEGGGVYGTVAERAFVKPSGKETVAEPLYKPNERGEVHELPDAEVGDFNFGANVAPVKKLTKKEQVLRAKLQSDADLVRESMGLPADMSSSGQPLTEAERRTLPGGGQENATGGRPPKWTALANAQVDRERATVNLTPLMSEARLANPKVWDEAMDRLERNPQAAVDLIAELQKARRATTVQENALLLQRRISLRNDHNRAMVEYVAASRRNAGEAELNGLETRERNLYEQLDQLDKVTRETGTEWGRAGQFRRQLAAEDYSLGGMLRSAEAAKGRPLTAAERVEVAELQSQIAELQKRLDEAKAAGRAKPGRASDEGFALAQAKKGFGQRLVQDRDARAPMHVKVWRSVSEALNIPRSIMASVDFPLLRQGMMAMLSHPVRTSKAVPDMIRSFFSDKVADRAQYEIEHRANADLYLKIGLEITSRDGALNAHEEGFLSRLAGKIPVAGALVRASERSYQTVMNRIRADSFDSMASLLGAKGQLTQAEAKVIANYVNVMTGRGPLYGAEKAATLLTQVFFAPRWAVSRFQMLLGQPLYSNFAESAPRARQQIAREYGRIATGMAMAIGLAAMAGFSLQRDPRSSDFGKMQLNNTRLDFTGGLGSVGTFLARMTSGETMTGRGEVSSIRGVVPYGRDNAAAVAGRFVRSKLAPIPGAGLNLLSGTNVVGQPVTVGGQALELTTPLFARDVYDAMRDLGVPKGTATSTLGLLGMGMTTYDVNSPEKLRLGR